MQIGRYLGRTVFLESTGRDGKIDFKVQDALVLLYVQAHLPDEKLVNSLIHFCVDAKTLGIWVSGEDADRYFGRLLEILSIHQGTNHVMTGILSSNSLADCAIEFVVSAVPARERFDEWTSYVIVALSTMPTDEVHRIRTYLL